MLAPAMTAANATETPPDPVKLVDAFEAAGGKFEGYRRSGAKGICAMGEFVGSAEGRALSVASAFSGQTVGAVCCGTGWPADRRVEAAIGILHGRFVEPRLAVRPCPRWATVADDYILRV